MTKSEHENAERLALIERMIQEARSRFEEDGFFYLLWGWIVLLASLTHYLLIQISFEHHWLPWPVFLTVASITAGIVGYKKSKNATVKTYFDRLMGYLWGGIGISIFTVLFFSGKIGFTGSYPILLVLYAIGTFVSGGMLKFKPLIIGAFINWILAIVSIFVVFEHQLLCLALAITCGYIVPGYLLKRKHKHELQAT